MFRAKYICCRSGTAGGHADRFRCQPAASARQQWRRRGQSRRDSLQRIPECGGCRVANGREDQVTRQPSPCDTPRRSHARESLFVAHPSKISSTRREVLGGHWSNTFPRREGTGSGVIIASDGLILTNNHVVSGADSVVVELADGREFTAEDIRTDPATDLAVLRIKKATNLPAARLGDSDTLRIGDWVLAIGNPFELEASVSAGIISAKGRSLGSAERASFLQTDAAINPGNSGGPLVNLRGEVVGINTAIASSNGAYQGIGFAIPVNLTKWVTDQLVSKGSVSRAWLGIGIAPVTSGNCGNPGDRPTDHRSCRAAGDPRHARRTGRGPTRRRDHAFRRSTGTGAGGIAAGGRAGSTGFPPGVARDSSRQTDSADGHHGGTSQRDRRPRSRAQLAEGGRIGPRRGIGVAVGRLHRGVG